MRKCIDRGNGPEYVEMTATEEAELRSHQLVMTQVFERDQAARKLATDVEKLEARIAKAVVRGNDAEVVALRAELAQLEAT